MTVLLSPLDALWRWAIRKASLDLAQQFLTEYADSFPKVTR